MKSPVLRRASIFIGGECVKQEFPEIWQRFAENRLILTCCPQSGGSRGIMEKVATIIACSNPKEIVVLTVDGSPHCYMLHASVEGAIFISKTEIPVEHFVITSEGEINRISGESVRVGRYLHLVEKCIKSYPEILKELERLSLEQCNLKGGV